MVAIYPLETARTHLGLQTNNSNYNGLLDVFKKLETLSGSNVSVKWYYEEDDEDMLEAGEDYEAIIDLDFEMIEVEEI